MTVVTVVIVNQNLDSLNLDSFRSLDSVESPSLVQNVLLNLVLSLELKSESHCRCLREDGTRSDSVNPSGEGSERGSKGLTL